MTEPQLIEPESKDWTAVISAGCGECGFDPSTLRGRETGDRLRATIPPWQSVLERDDARLRPSPQVWSPVEYACHARDTCRIFRERLALMLDQDDPVFANWDQDATAVEDRYWAQDPATVARQYDEQATATADAFDAVRDDQWHRPGRRSNGSAFTVETLVIYFLHDVEHHLRDVGVDAW
jgi:hypothetical protein